MNLFVVIWNDDGSLESGIGGIFSNKDKAKEAIDELVSAYPQWRDQYTIVPVKLDEIIF